jgi:hypothetical protein
MARRPILLGDQLVLEEDSDETYVPSEQGKTLVEGWNCSLSTDIVIDYLNTFLKIVLCVWVFCQHAYL